MIDVLKGFPSPVQAFAARGRVTSEDYERVLIPAVEAALARHDKQRLYYEIGADFTGIDPGAVIDDFKVGMEHLSRWERIAIVTDVEWIRHAARAFAFMIPGPVRAYGLDEAGAARDWISSGAA